MQGAPGRSGAPSFFPAGRSAGFTLVELMITVAILGILMMVAVPNFLRMRERAKVSEAKANLGAIRVTQHAYYSEYNHYVGNQPVTPDRTANPSGRLPWTATTRFSILGFAPDGPVYFSYALGGADFPVGAFLVEAHGDLDGDGDWSIWTITNGDKELHHQGDIL